MATERIQIEKCNGERIINYFRMALAVLYLLAMIFVSVIRNIGGGAVGGNAFSFYFYIGPVVLFVYGAVLFFILREKEILHPFVKYFCVTLDMLIIFCCFAATGIAPPVLSPLTFMRVYTMFAILFILLGAYRYNKRCAFYSGILAAVLYAAVLFILRNYLVRYAAFIDGRMLEVDFRFYNEILHAPVFILFGAIIGLAAERHQMLLVQLVRSETEISEATEQTVLKTREIARIILEAAEEISGTSNEVYTIANSQAASVEEIASTIDENAKIDTDIADKTGSVAVIAVKMEDDVVDGFAVLEENVKKLGDIKNKNDGVISGIVQLGNKIAKIRNIIQIINTITDQTKVIAFNAALEAASSGEMGKRFAVVAGEVNRLADDIVNLTKQIKEQIEEIQNSSSSLIISSEEGADMIAEGNKLIKRLEDIFKEIKAGAEITSNQAQIIKVSTQKQRKSSEHITTAITDISKGLGNYVQSTKDAAYSLEKLIDLVWELENILNQAPVSN
jgi:methyl-accepting chemotaxis protein